ncbi:MAG: anticodon nuclease [Candidatus Kapabacteria bacterium]|nr:anticodon nuclease [Ignavibacteria bacterium]MBK6418907.1 anticodon nuclease [Ignavibacteria bacterium]MBP6509612.1 anticodon nuclease [Candidatus Kapabacteria bacterium]MBP7093466.1 anticodon nuclease [Candidatus Kapabacteria bacterium]
MGKTLNEIAQQLKDANKKVQLIYAFNGTGKTRLSRAFKDLIAPKSDAEGGQQSDLSQKKFLYYSAFTEDLFYWDNDLDGDAEPKLKIQPNSFTKWVLDEQGQDRNVTSTFQHYSDDKLSPTFSADFSEVTFSFERGNNVHEPNIKISKGEESSFIWSVFHSLIEQIISELNIAEVADRSTDVFNMLEYVFVDDPVSSLDENHLIELAVNLASLIKSSQSDLKFIVTTHSPLFYNVLFNELNGKACYMLERFEDGTFLLTEKHGDSNKSFSYHLYLKHTIELAIIENKVEKYHFTLLRNLYEKTASFLGYPKWSELLPDDKQLYLNRVIQFTSHSTLSNETVVEPTQAEKATVKLLLEHLKNNYGFWPQEQQNV